MGVAVPQFAPAGVSLAMTAEPVTLESHERSMIVENLSPMPEILIPRVRFPLQVSRKLLALYKLHDWAMG